MARHCRGLTTSSFPLQPQPIHMRCLSRPALQHLSPTQLSHILRTPPPPTRRPPPCGSAHPRATRALTARCWQEMLRTTTMTPTKTYPAAVSVIRSVSRTLMTAKYADHLLFITCAAPTLPACHHRACHRAWPDRDRDDAVLRCRTQTPPQEQAVCVQDPSYRRGGGAGPRPSVRC